MDGNIVNSQNTDLEWTKHPALERHVAWINNKDFGLRRSLCDGSSIVDGAVVVAEAVRRFNDPSRMNEIFEDMVVI